MKRPDDEISCVGYFVAEDKEMDVVMDYITYLEDEVYYLKMRAKRLACSGCSWAQMWTIYCEYCKKEK